MSEFSRVKDKTTGHEFSIRYPDPEQHEVLDKPAVDLNGDPLPAKPKVSVAKKATEKKNDPTNGAESAKTPKEGSE